MRILDILHDKQPQNVMLFLCMTLLMALITLLTTLTTLLMT